ncbi:MAG: ice-binding family protein [Ilumatobacteraceae bacterium]
MTTRVPRTIGGLVAVLALAVISTGGTATAAEAPVDLGTAASFSVLAGSTVTNTGSSVLSDDLGLHPGTDITGFPPGIVNGTVHTTDAVALQAQSDTTIAYDDAAGRSDTATLTVLGGQTLVSGVYSGSSLDLTGTLTLDAQGDPDAVFIFKSGSELTTASTSTVALINGAQACNVFWQVTSSATLGSGSEFVGTLIALTSITAVTGANVNGRLLARNGAVTLDTNTITTPAPCPASTVGDDDTATTTPGDDDTATTTPGDDDTATTTPGDDDTATTTPGTTPGLGTLPSTGATGAASGTAGGLLLLALGAVLVVIARRPGRSNRTDPTRSVS